MLFVHLQRIIFDFDTMNNDKINTYFEFPNVLDLTPYSFYEVMGKENRLGKKGEEKKEEEAKDGGEEEAKEGSPEAEESLEGKK